MARTVRRSVARFAIAVAILAALASAPAAMAADRSIDIAGFAFAPQSTTVNVGDTVTWANSDARGHTATADDGTFDTGTIAGNGTKSVTMSTAGSFGYHCKIHPEMTATLIVVAAGAATAPPTDTAIGPAGRVADSWPLWFFVLAAVVGGVAGVARFSARRERAR